jgi:FO synthase
MDSGLRRALARARDGKALDLDEATVLLGPGGRASSSLLEVAGRVRDAGLVDAGRPGVVTYSRKVFVPLTRLCRDRCHYCTFATVPGRLPAPYLSIDEVLEIAAQGAALGCKEALFTLGDRPEDRWGAARQWLEEAGYDSTLSYLRACAIAVLESTGLLPHLNPGVLSWAEQLRLKPVAASMGMMLETTAEVPPTSAAPTRTPRCGCRCSRTPAGCPCPSPPACSSGSARRCASGPSRSSRSAPRTGGTATCRR